MDYRGRELELDSSELSEVSGGAIVTEANRVGGPCKEPSPPTPIPLPYPCLRSGSLLRYL